MGLHNGGSIRFDDVLPPGPVTQYDVIRLLPFGGPVVRAQLRGSLLRRVLDQGRRNAGTGGYLQTGATRRADGGSDASTRSCGSSASCATSARR